MRPNPLTAESKPGEVTSWIDAFEAYYTKSGIDQNDYKTRLQYFRSNLDSNLEQQILAKIHMDTGHAAQSLVLEDFMDIIRTSFLEAFPLIQHRYDVYTMRQHKGEKGTSLFAR